MATTTTIKVDRDVRDRLARIATSYGGVSLGEGIERLIREHEDAQIIAAYEDLHADPVASAELAAEVRLFDGAAAADLRSNGEITA